MSKHIAGLFGNASGKLAGTVAGSARTELGKVTTLREYVIPTDPKSATQLEQRELMRAAGYQATLWGANQYRRSWNNTVGLLPGFQCLSKYLIDNMEISEDIAAWKATLAGKTLGPVYNGAIVSAVASAAGKIKFTWSTAIVGDYCAAADIVHVVLVNALYVDSQAPTLFLSDPEAAVRSDGLYETPSALVPADTYKAFVWFENQSDTVWRSSSVLVENVVAKAA